MHILFIVNPTAGVSRSFSGLFEALSLLSREGHLLSVRNTTKAGDATTYVLDHGSEMDWVICCGGDGTLNETISGLMQLPGKKPLLSYLPRGSTNDFATTLSIPLDPIQATSNLLSHHPRPLDVGLLNGRSFVYVACFGAFTKSSYAASQTMKNTLGHAAYILEGIRDFTSLRPYDVHITADGESLDGEYLFGAVSNSTSIGGVMRLPDELVSLDDGLFELILVPKPQSAAHLQAMVLALISQDYTSPDLVFRQVGHVHVETKSPLPWALDGEFAPSHHSVHIVNHRHGVNMVI